jgi:hypothetical protein
VSDTSVQTLAGIVLRLTERVERLERRLDAHDADHEREKERAYHETMEQAEYE